MKKVKKLLATLVVTALTFSLAGCGGASTNTAQTGQTGGDKVLKSQVDV